MRGAHALLAAFLISPALSAQELPPDVITLKNGRQVEGVVLDASSEKVLIEQRTRQKTIRRKNIEAMSGPRILFPLYAEKLRENYHGGLKDPAQAMRLAEWCRENGLLRDVEIHYWHALQIDPTYEPAHEALGHVKARGRWQARVKGHGHLDWRDLQEVRMDFTDGWQFTTMHFEVQAGGALLDALNACSSLEILYQAYYAHFQEFVGFHEVQEPIKVAIYPTFDDYPSITDFHHGYFDPGGRQLYTFFQDGEAVRLIHEATHAIMFFSGRETLRSDPAFPGWLNEGLAVYMESAMEGGPGAPKFKLGRHAPHWFDLLINEPDPHGLIRVLNLSTSDFLASSRLEQKYAEAYTLTYFLLHSRDSDIERGFWEFLRSAYERKGSMSHFKNAMGVRDLDVIEEQWMEFVNTFGAQPKPGRR